MPRRSRWGPWTVLCAIVAAGMVAGCAPPPVPGEPSSPIRRVSLTADGAQIPAGGVASGMSSDGRVVLLMASGDLVDGPDEANTANAYLRDTATGALRWLRDPSLDPSTQGVDHVHLLSGDGTRAVVGGTGLDGSGRAGIFLFHGDTASFQYMGTLFNPYFNSQEQLSDISHDGRYVVGTDGLLAGSTQVFDAERGQWSVVYSRDRPGAGPIMRAPKFDRTDGRVIIGVTDGGASLWSVGVDGADPHQIDVDLGGTSLLETKPVAAGRGCVLVFTQYATRYDFQVVDLSTGEVRAIRSRTFRRAPEGTASPANDFSAFDVDDTCRFVVGQSYAWGRLAVIDLARRTIARAFPPVWDVGVALRQLQISDDGRTLLLSTANPLVVDDTNEQMDAFVRLR